MALELVKSFLAQTSTHPVWPPVMFHVWYPAPLLLYIALAVSWC